SVEEVFQLTRIDRFFLAEMARLIAAARALEGTALESLDAERLRELKRDGFSDRAIARATSSSADAVRALRERYGIRPQLAQIDTLAAEYPAQTNYLYFTYGAQECDVPPAPGKKILIIGSGCYRIGSSVEFDWCCINAVAEARRLGYQTLLLNCNP